MPLKQGKSRKVVSQNIEELHQGAQYQRTKAKFGSQRANKQAVAVALKQAGLSRKQPFVKKAGRGR